MASATLLIIFVMIAPVMAFVADNFITPNLKEKD